jgi:hypothetical protein
LAKSMSSCGLSAWCSSNTLFSEAAVIELGPSAVLEFGAD